MLTLEDCIGLSELDEEEILAIAEHEHIPEMAAVWSHWGNTQVSIINGQAADPVAAWKTMVENIKAGF